MGVKDRSPDQDVGDRRALRRLIAMLPADNRNAAVRLLGLMLLGGIAELVTVGSVLPFLAVLTGQGAALRLPGVLAWVPTSVIGMTTLFIAAAIGAACVRLLLNWKTQRLAMETGHWIASEIHRRVLLQSYSYHVNSHSSSLISALQKVQDLVWGVLLPALQGLSAALMAALILTGLVWLDAWAALAAALLFGLIYAVVSLLLRRRFKRYSAILSEAYDERVRMLQETLGAIRDIIIDGSQPVHLRAFRASDRRLSSARVRVSFFGTAPRFIIEAFGLVALSLLAALLSFRTGGVLAALPLLGALALGAQRLLPLFQQIYQSWSTLTGYRNVISDLNALLALPAAPETAAATIPPLPFKSMLKVENVTFCYPGRSAPALSNVMLDIPKGCRVALTGKTGSGKSTLADVIMGLLDPTSGSVSVDGVPLTSGNRAAWRRNIAHVPQAIHLLDASIAENIAFGEEADAVDGYRLRLAVRTAQLDELIAELPEGMETRVGERGVRLSGGQRQRLALARAIYRDKPLLVLDEATSALDDATERAVLDALDALQRRGVTILIIAHRKSTMAGADMVLRLKAGKLTAEAHPPYAAAESVAPSLSSQD